MTAHTLKDRLPPEERAFLDLLLHTPLWHPTPSETHLDVSNGAVTFRFSPDESPRIAAPPVPDGYPVAWATVARNQVHFGAHSRWIGHTLHRAVDWERAGLADYTESWQELADWVAIAPAEFLAAVADSFERLRPTVTTDQDAGRATFALCAAITAPTHFQVTKLLEQLPERQGVLAREMLADGAHITELWGPEQMSVYRLRLARGPVTVQFGSERGLPYGVEVAHPGFHDRGPYYGNPSYLIVWRVWAGRVGAPAENADYEDWRAVFDWLADDATSDEFAAVDALFAG